MVFVETLLMRLNHILRYLRFFFSTCLVESDQTNVTKFGEDKPVCGGYKMSWLEDYLILKNGVLVHVAKDYQGKVTPTLASQQPF